MSQRNSSAAKRMRREDRKAKAEWREEVRQVEGCTICGSPHVVWVDASDEVADPNYRAMCLPHLAYAVSTIFVGENIIHGDMGMPARQRAFERRQRQGRFVGGYATAG